MDQDLKTEELSAIVNEIRERVRARHPSGLANGVPLPDLLPILHARDAAGAKVAAIGSVNPRPPGLVNNTIQSIKRFFARLLDWHVRDQVEFNRGVITAVDAILDALNENNRALTQLAAAHAAMDDSLEPLRSEIRELKDIRTHWTEWRREWERKLSVNEVQFLRAAADLESSFQHRVTMMEANCRDMVKIQHSSYEVALERSAMDIQKRLWADLEKVRAEFEKLIHIELRLVRQRGLQAAATAPASQAVPITTEPRLAIDYEAFADRFRGTEESVLERQRVYLPPFQGRKAVLDIGCGRGEFLQLMRSAGVPARGIDLSETSIALCRARGLDVERADLFVYLQSLPDGALDGIFSAQVVEHIAPARLPEMIQLAAAKLERGGLLAIETPNPECLAIFASHFYLDPTHERPVPSRLLAFYMEESGLGQIEVRPLTPAIESMPSLAAVPAEFREAFFGGLDYAIFGRKL